MSECCGKFVGGHVRDSDCELTIENAALKARVAELEKKLTEVKGCDHLDAPYRRLLAERAAMRSALEGISRCAHKDHRVFAGAAGPHPCPCAAEVQEALDTTEAGKELLEELERLRTESRLLTIANRGVPDMIARLRAVAKAQDCQCETARECECAEQVKKAMSALRPGDLE
jgi:hypothetical protein